MVIRPARPEDAPAIARYIAMAESEMVHFFAGVSDPEKAGPALEPFILSPMPCRYSMEFILVAEADRRPAGVAVVFPADRQPELDTVLLAALARRGHSLTRLTPEGEPGTYYLSSMAVDPAFRGRGIGSALMAAAEEQGRQLGFTRISLLVSKGKGRVQALYERQGYAVVAEITIADVTYRRMVKTL